MGVKDPKDGTPIDEAIRRMSGPRNPDIARSLRLAAEAFGEDPNDATDDIAFALAWMIDDINERRGQGEPGLDPAPHSPEILRAMSLLEDLRAGKIECRRTT